MKYKYLVFGLSVASEFFMPELLETTENPQVSIKYGKVPAHLQNPLKTGAAFEISGEEFILHVKDTVSFWVKKGKEIVVEEKKGADHFDVQVFLLGSAFGALLHQRNFLPLHGSSVCIGENNLIVCGQSGAGKSSLAAAFFTMGHRILNDDISVLDMRGGELLIQPGFPFMKLWKDCLEELKIDTQGKRKIRMQLEKYSVPLGELFEKKPQILDTIIILKVHNKPDIELTEIVGLDKLMALRPHIYRVSFLVGEKKERLVFQQMGKLASQIKLFEVKRPQKPFNAISLAQKLKKIIYG